jgi:hypothetical protein
MEGTIGSAAFSDKNIQRRRHHHANVAITGQMFERNMDARTQMRIRHGGTHCQTQFRKKLVKLIQDWCSLRDMAEIVAGDGNDEVGH